MAYLTELATNFQRLVSLARNANHGADDTFETESTMRIAPTMRSRMQTFSEDMGNYGATYSFLSQDDGIQEDKTGLSAPMNNVKLHDEVLDTRKEAGSEDIVDILHDRTMLPLPLDKGIEGWLLEVFRNNRGFELGTYNPTILATTMKKQIIKWRDISMAFVSDVIVVVHRFIHSALAMICVDDGIRQALTDRLSDELIERYQKAISTTKFLLEVESNNTPITLNHHFSDNLQKR